MQDILEEADNQLKQVEQQIGPLQDENEDYQKRFQQNEVLIA